MRDAIGGGDGCWFGRTKGRRLPVKCNIWVCKLFMFWFWNTIFLELRFCKTRSRLNITTETLRRCMHRVTISIQTLQTDSFK